MNRRDMFHYTSCGLRNVFLRNGFVVKETPYGKAVSIQDVEGLHRVIGLHLIRNKPRLTSAEVRFLRKELDMSQSNLAKILGVGETSVRNWESGRIRVTGPAERILRALYEEYATGKSQLREMVERFGEINREAHAKKLEFEETKNGWRAAA